jgi:hypothetical protein
MSRFLPAFAASFGGAIDGEVLAEVWRFVRLSSRSRGRDRYRCLDEALRLLERRAESAPQRGRLSSTAYALEAWLACELDPSPKSLAAATTDGQRPALARVLAWSQAVDAALLEAPTAQAYASAGAALPFFAQDAELRLVPAPSPANRGSLKRLGVRFSCHGYPISQGPRVLVVGDTMAALESARRSRLSFFPIVPGREEESWARLAESGFPRFLRGERAPSRGLLASFLSAFSSNPPWMH